MPFDGSNARRRKLMAVRSHTRKPLVQVIQHRKTEFFCIVGTFLNSGRRLKFGFCEIEHGNDH